MTAVDIHSASAINSDSVKEDITMTPENMVVENGATDTTTVLMNVSEDIVPDESASTHSGPMEIDLEADNDSSEHDALMQDILMAVGPKTEAPAVETRQTIEAAQPVQAPIATDWYAYYSTANKARKSVSKAHGRNTSISATMELPWTVDNTSSSPQKSLKRVPSLSVPPPPKAVDMFYSSNSDSGNEKPPTNTESPKLHPLMTKVPPSSPAPYTHSSIRPAPSPYSSTSSSDSQSHSQQQQQPSHSLTNPPGYIQNTHASFSTVETDTSNTSASHPSTPRTTYSQTHSISLSRPSSSHSQSYSPTDKSAPPIPLYNNNTSPFYTNNTYHAYSGADYGGYSNGYGNSLFSPTFSFSTPSTLTPKTPASASRRGILDNDPSIYLRPEGDSADDDGSIWDTATKWAKIASNKLSLNGNGNAGERRSSSIRGGGIGPQNEFSVSSGLWKMVGRLNSGEEGPRRDLY